MAQDESFMDRAKNAVEQFMNNSDDAKANREEQQAAQSAIDDAKNHASSKEQKQLQELEQQLKQNDQLS